MSVPSGDRYSSSTASQTTRLVTTASPKGVRRYFIHVFSWHVVPLHPSVSPVSILMSSSICERVTPRLSHANSAVVLSAVKVLMKFMEMLPKDLDYYGTLLKKLAPPLVTLLSAEPELQYVALRNINLIVQRR